MEFTEFCGELFAWIFDRARQLFLHEEFVVLVDGTDRGEGFVGVGADEGEGWCDVGDGGICIGGSGL